MTPEQWAQAKELFDAARDQPEGERAAWLDSACDGDRVVRDEVERLLAHDGDSLPSPAAGLLASAALALAVGQMLSHYRVEGKAGEGGMGIVYRAYDTRLRRRVALKVLRSEHLSDEASQQRLMREARAASALNHPNIVGIYEVGSEKGVNFIAMEFVEGKSLGEIIPAKGLPLGKVLGYAVQIASGLAKAHSLGVVHRDLKPGNVLLTEDGVVKLLDFGLARHVHLDQGDTTVSVEGGIAGTPAYMSPEQAEGKSLDARSDIFSFGVVLYEMLAGRRAFTGRSPASIMAAVLEAEPPPLGTSVPVDLEKIVARCLRKELPRRFQHMGDVKLELEELKAAWDSGHGLPTAAATSGGSLRWRWMTVPPAMLAGILIGGWIYSDTKLDLSRHRYTPVVTVMRPRRIQEGGGIGAQLPAWSPDGKSIAYSSDGLHVQRIDSPESSRLTAHGGVPFFSADGARIFYLDSGETPRELWSVSVAGGVPERVMRDLGGFGPLLGGAAISPDGKALVVVSRRKAGDEEMSVWVSTPPGAPLYEYPGSPVGRLLSRAGLCFSPDGSKLLLTMSVTGPPTEWWLLQWPPPEGPRPESVRRIFEQGPGRTFYSSADWLPDNRHLVASVHAEGDVGGPLWIADTVTERWLRVTPDQFVRVTPKVSRQGRVLFAFFKEEEHAIEIPFDSSAIRPLLAGFRREQYPSWSPVGEQILFVTNERGDPEIWLASRKEGWQRPVVTQRDFPADPGKRQFISPVFSPDGTRVAYTARGAIWVSPLAGGTPARICEGYCPTWSPDGAWLAFVTNPRGTKHALMRVPIGRPQDAAAIRTDVGLGLPRWSPDGKWITAQLPGGFGVVSPDGARTKVLYLGRVDWGSACGWSHDSSTLFLAYLAPQGRVLSAFDVQTGRERRLRDLGTLHFSYFAYHSAGLSLSPDGKSLAASTWSVRFEPWIIDGLEPPRSLWARLLRPWFTNNPDTWGGY